MPLLTQKTTPNTLSPTGFIRINPSTAPLNPPGAAPTLTTIYDEAATMQTCSTTASPSNSLSKEAPTPKQKSKRRKSSNPFRAKAAKEGVVGTEKEKRRTQTIADSLDFGGDLQMDEENGGSSVVGEDDERLGRRKIVVTEIGLGSVP
ncbi:MAG: hypothetical protein Q9161_004447 [Pseudevernia consocians]